MKLRKMNNKEERTFRLIHLAYIILIICITLYIIIENLNNTGNILLIILHVVAFLVIASLRHTVFKDNKIIRSILPYIEIAIIIPLAFLTESAVALWFILMLNIDVIIDFYSVYSIVFSVVGYISYITCYILKLNPQTVPQGGMIFLIGAVQYTIIMSVGFIAKKFYEQSKKYKQLAALLKAQMLELEQMAVIKERNRMAGEIHDTVGHQLTTALVQLEATAAIIDKDINQAKSRIVLIKEQVKESLNELRNSIRQLREENYNDFENLLLDLVKKVKVTTGIDVRTDFDLKCNIPQRARKALYRMTMEAITNAIKHGRCEKIWLKLKCAQNILTLVIENDGIVPNDLTYAFGLNRMKERIEELEGSISHGVGEKGFYIKAELNVNRGNING